jgi:hypothetical protein
VSARARAQRAATLRVALSIALAVILLGGGAWLLDRVLRDAPSRGPVAPDAAAAGAVVSADAARARPVAEPGGDRGAVHEDAAVGGEDAALADSTPAAALQAPRPVANGGRVRILVRPTASLFVDGVEVARAVEDFTTTLAPGAHLIEARAPGFARPARRRVIVKPDHSHRVDLRLTR